MDQLSLTERYLGINKVFQSISSIIKVMTMKNVEKILAIKHAIDHTNTEEQYYDLLERMGDLKRNYWEYMTTEPINCDIELKRLPEADYDLCAALLTMLLREDHFSNGALRVRYEAGQVDAILRRMISLIET